VSVTAITGVVVAGTGFTSSITANATTSAVPVDIAALQLTIIALCQFTASRSDLAELASAITAWVAVDAKSDTIEWPPVIDSISVLAGVTGKVGVLAGATAVAVIGNHPVGQPLVDRVGTGVSVVSQSARGIIAVR
jgi:hypothetical protein